MTELPETLRSFREQFPRAWEAYVGFAEACDREGPLAGRWAELIKVAVSAALRREGGLVAHISRSLSAGASAEEVYQAVLLTGPLAGFGTSLRAYAIARERLEKG
ncbi:MAG: carboxymuconolactone decarboxylase family protein [Nitrospinota bacterium]